MIYGQVLVDGLIVGLMFALVAMGLSLIYGVMNIVNFAHGEFMMLAMYFCFFMWSVAGRRSARFHAARRVAHVLRRRGGLPAADPARAAATMVAQIFATFGLLLFIQAAANFLWKSDARTIPESWATGMFQVGGLFFSGPELVAGGGALVTARALYWFINRTETGLALQAVAEDPQAARLMGIDSDRMFAIAWGVSLRRGRDRRRTALDVLRHHAAGRARAGRCRRSSRSRSAASARSPARSAAA